MRLTKAIINTSNLNKNFLNIRRKVGKSKIMAVVKADAYGHGVKTVVDALNSLAKQKPEYFAVAIPDEGVELRQLKIKQPILIFYPLDNFQASKFFKFNLIPSVFTQEHLKILLKEKKRLKSSKKILVHVKIDTGMNRLGVDYQEAFKFIKKLSLDNNFRIDGIFTHFATSDEVGSSYAKLQIKRFNEVIKSLKENNLNYGLAHAANSGAILDFPEAYYDMVRPGIALYGYYPSLQTSESIKLYPVMSLVSKVSSIKKMKKGESVSYGRRYFTKTEANIISVPIGYADGFTRALTNKAQAIINGNFYNQVGTVTMDRIMFDVANDKIKINDDVILLGQKGKLKIDAWDWSKKINTIPYEVTCGISKRVPRIKK
ncbi:MAG: alanine racemase [Ignavibacteriaceae bacterium]|nr:alanine racemase [Ignavibacterium sp.]MCC6254574.1 alanine racemase [Ignavibacteriaceae bacterium]HRN26567.1 alanine racemase [Ignavibacteriaceae bacterium]HRQ54158.1 alanine racemase [Ignavibacteriaceae bacterium]